MLSFDSQLVLLLFDISWINYRVRMGLVKWWWELYSRNGQYSITVLWYNCCTNLPQFTGTMEVSVSTFWYHGTPKLHGILLYNQYWISRILL